MAKKELVQITFHFNNHEVFVVPCCESWEQFGCLRMQMLSPEFLNKLWELLNEYELLND